MFTKKYYTVLRKDGKRVPEEGRVTKIRFTKYGVWAVVNDSEFYSGKPEYFVKWEDLDEIWKS